MSFEEYQSTAMVRPVDKMGRVVIPKEMRRYLGIEDEKDSFEIYIKGRTLVLKKLEAKCIFCDRLADSVELNGHTVCKDCIEKLRELKEETKDII